MSFVTSCCCTTQTLKAASGPPRLHGHPDLGSGGVQVACEVVRGSSSLLSVFRRRSVTPHLPPSQTCPSCSFVTQTLNAVSGPPAISQTAPPDRLPPASTARTRVGYKPGPAKLQGIESGTWESPEVVMRIELHVPTPLVPSSPRRCEVASGLACRFNRNYGRLLGGFNEP